MKRRTNNHRFFSPPPKAAANLAGGPTAFHRLRLFMLCFFCSFCLAAPLHVFAEGSEQQASPETKEITLEELIKAAAENNPEIKSSAQAAAASKARIPAAGTLPDPTVKFETMGNLIPPTLMKGDPSSARTYGIEQEIPFPGKLGLRENIASVEAESQRHNLELVNFKVISELKQAFFDLYLVNKTIDVLFKNKELLDNFENIAESRYKVGQTSQQDVLKAQVEISKVLDRLLSQGEKKRIAEAKINSLLYRPAETPVGRPAEFKKAELAYSLEDLTQLAQSNSPALKVSESEVSRKGQEVELARKEFYPDFAAGFTFFEREENPNMYGLMVSAKLPLYFWRKQQPELDAAKLNLSSATNTRESTLSTLRYQVREAYTTAATSEKLANLYVSAIVPQSNLALNSAVANYQVGKIDFLQLIDASVSLLEYQLKYYEAMAQFHKALAQLEPLVGVELVK
ncbi:Outer membrane efflux protein [Syntrophobacter sp. SbD1]|nr:Outer membrane efflux protein [Syntrophobacter sp. SbD1]